MGNDKGAIRNQTIKSASYKKKTENKIEENIINEINNIENDNTNTHTLIIRLNEKHQELDNLKDRKINGIMLRTKAEYKDNEKKSKYFASLEKRKAEKNIHKIIVKNTDITGQTVIINEDVNSINKMFSKKQMNNN